jgi:hypothetical protein
LRPYIEGKSPRSPPIPVVMDGEHEFMVDKILEHDFIKVSSKKTQLECLIKWKGYTDEHSTWEDMDSLINCPAVVAKYKKERKLWKFSIWDFYGQTRLQRCREKNVVITTTIKEAYYISLIYKLA